MAQYNAADKAQAFGGLGGELVDGDGDDGVLVNGSTFDRMPPGEQGYDSMLAVVCGGTIMDAAEVLTIALELQESDDDISWDVAEPIYAVKTVATGSDGAAVVDFQTSDAVNLRGRKRYVRINVTPTLDNAADLAHWGACCVGMDPMVGPAS